MNLKYMMLIALQVHLISKMALHPRNQTLEGDDDDDGGYYRLVWFENLFRVGK